MFKPKLSVDRVCLIRQETRSFHMISPRILMELKVAVSRNTQDNTSSSLYTAPRMRVPWLPWPLRALDFFIYHHAAWKNATLQGQKITQFKSQ